MMITSNLNSKSQTSRSDVSTEANVHSAAIVRNRGLPEISQLVFASGHRTLLTLMFAALGAIGFGLVASYVVPAQFMATGYVKVNQREGYLISVRQSRAEDSAFIRAQEANVVLQTTLERALQDPDLQSAMRDVVVSDPVEWLRAQIKADIPTGSEQLAITASNPDERIAVQAARAVTLAYVAATTEQLRSGRKNRIAELEIATQEADSQLKQRWSALQSKAEKFGAGNPQSLSLTEQMKLQTYRESAQRLRALQFQRAQLDIQIEENQSKAPIIVAISPSTVEDMVNQSPDVVARREQIRLIDSKIHDIQQVSRDPQSPRLLRLQSDREHYATQLTELATSLTNKAYEKLQKDQLLASKPSDHSFEKQRALIQEEEASIAASMSELENVIEQSSGPSSVELEIIRHELGREKELADNLWKTLQELRIEEQAEPRVALSHLPQAVDKLSRNKQGKAVAASMLLGFFLAILTVGYFEWSSCHIRVPSDVTDNTGLEFFGAANRTKWNARVAFQDSNEMDACGPREVAATLLLKKKLKVPSFSLLVSSAVASETRGSVALELAQSSFENGSKVLLINCDPTDSILSKLWDKTLDETATRELAGAIADSRWHDAVQHSTESGYDYLNLMQSGQPLSLIAIQILPRVLEAAAESYDLVVVLGPAVLSSAETVLLATQTDLSLLAIQLGRSKFDLLSAAHAKLCSSGSNVLGAVATPVNLTLPQRKAIRTQSSTTSAPNSQSKLVPADLTANSECPESELQDELNLMRHELNAHESRPEVPAPKTPRVRRSLPTNINHRNSE